MASALQEWLPTRLIDEVLSDNDWMSLVSQWWLWEAMQHEECERLLYVVRYSGRPGTESMMRMQTCTRAHTSLHVGNASIEADEVQHCHVIRVTSGPHRSPCGLASCRMDDDDFDFDALDALERRANAVRHMLCSMARRGARLRSGARRV